MSNKGPQVDTVAFAKDDYGRVIIDFKALETLAYYCALEVVDDVQCPESEKDNILQFLGSYMFEILNTLFPEEVAEQYNENKTEDITKYYS